MQTPGIFPPREPRFYTEAVCYPLPPERHIPCFGTNVTGWRVMDSTTRSEVPASFYSRAELGFAALELANTVRDTLNDGVQE